MLEEGEYPKNAEKWILIREIPPLSIIKCNDTPICKTKETFSKIISTLTGTDSIIELNTICVLRVSIRIIKSSYLGITFCLNEVHVIRIT